MKKSENVFDPDYATDSPVIKFSGSRRAFNTTTQTVENGNGVRTPRDLRSGRKSIGNGRAEKIMSLVEDSFDTTMKRIERDEKELKAKCREDNLTVKITALKLDKVRF